MCCRSLLGVMGMGKGSARWALAAAAAYAVILVLVAFWPTPVDAGAAPWLFGVIDWLHGIGVPRWFGYGEIEFGANILYFIPMGVLLSWWLRRPWPAVLGGLSVSAVIEAGQLLALPDRVPSVRDIVANTLGTLAGVALVMLCRRLLRRRMPPSAASRRR